MPRLTLRTQLTLLYAVPFFVSGAFVLAIPLSQTSMSAPVNSQLVHPQPRPDHYTHNLLVGSAIGLAVMAVLSLVIGWWIAGRFLRPLRTITATARDISATHLHRRLDLRRRRDEFGQLADTLNALFARLEASFDAQRHFVANASHELRTPLTAERALLQVALADPDADAQSLRLACHEVLALGEQQERLIGALLTLATGESGVEHRQPFDLAALTGRVVAARGPEAQRRGIRVETALDPAPAAGDPSLVASLVTNLVENAVRYNSAGGSVEITTAATPDGARLTVGNTGPVVPPGELARLFQPFQRLDTARTGHGDGHGLGLAIVRAIATAHGAIVVPRARPGGGLVVEVTFP